MIVDVVEALSSGLEAPPFCLHNLLAEAAPEPALPIPPDPAIIKPALDFNRICNSMIFGYMCFELLATVTGPPTSLVWDESAWLVALPQLELAMLAVFVTLPVILAAKSFRALRVSAPVRLFVSLLVLPGARLSAVRIDNGRSNLLELTRPWEDFATVRLVTNYLTAVTDDTGNRVGW